jgi:hypothetical protein
MSTYKQFLASDVVVTPFEVNKGFTFQGAAALTGSNVGIDRYLGKNLQSNPFNLSTSPTTGQITTQYQELVYDSIKQLYYGNYANSGSNYGLPAVTSSLVPGKDTEGDVLVGVTASTGRYVDFFPTTLTFQKYFPISRSAEIGVLSIPAGLFGNYIVPGTFRWTADSGSIIDDGEGNLIYESQNKYCGNIFYQQGVAVITSDTDPTNDGYGFADYGLAIYGLTDALIAQNFITSSNVTCSFSSSFTIYETQYKCTLRENEFNFSLNPSIISGSTDGTPYNFVTSSYFNPYVTTVGLYDDNQNLLAVGKLAQPLPTSPTTDTTILINIDR